MASGCAPKLMKLPAGPGAPAADGRETLATATAACRGVTTMSAELGASGSVGGQRLRGRLLVGVAAPASARIEAVAPFGQPIFIFVARGSEATLLLPRDDRVLERGRPDSVLEALTGLPLDAAALRLALSGCPTSPDADSVRMVGENWRVAADGQDQIYLRRQSRSAPWQIVSVVHAAAPAAWRAEYRDFQNGLPRSVRFVDPRRFDLRLTLSQLEVNAALGDEVFRVEVPAGARPITIDELRDAGPLRAAERRDARQSTREN